MGGVSKSSQRVEFNTVIGFQILARFHKEYGKEGVLFLMTTTVEPDKA